MMHPQKGVIVSFVFGSRGRLWTAKELQLHPFLLSKNLPQMKLLRTSILILLIILPLSSIANIINFSFEKEFNYAAIYDYDLKRYTTSPLYDRITITVQIDESGKGTLIFYEQTKKILYITAAYYERDNNNVIVLECTNNYGKEIVAAIGVTHSYNSSVSINSVKLENSDNNTAIIHGNNNQDF